MLEAENYFGLYINLDRSIERRRNLEKQLADLGLERRYARFPAVDGAATSAGSRLRPGEVGVFLSHAKAVERARDIRKCVHILEDDALLSEHAESVISDAIADHVFDRYDILFTDMMVHCHVEFLKNLKRTFDEIKIPSGGRLRFNQVKLVDLSEGCYAAQQSYVVGARSLDKLLALYKAEIASGPKMPVDIFVQ